MEIKTKDYTLQYDRDTQTVTCCGAFRLSLVEEYAPIVDLFNEVADSSPKNGNKPPTPEVQSAKF